MPLPYVCMSYLSLHIYAHNLTCTVDINKYSYTLLCSSTQAHTCIHIHTYIHGRNAQICAAISPCASVMGIPTSGPHVYVYAVYIYAVYVYAVYVYAVYRKNYDYGVCCSV